MSRSTWAISPTVLAKSALIPPSDSLMTLIPLPRTRSRSACGSGRCSSSGGAELQSRISASAYSVRAASLTPAAAPVAAHVTGLKAAAAAAAARAAEKSRRFMVLPWCGMADCLPHTLTQQLGRGPELGARQPGESDQQPRVGWRHAVVGMHRVQPEPA